jgi:hypothetical protein
MLGGCNEAMVDSKRGAWMLSPGGLREGLCAREPGMEKELP